MLVTFTPLALIVWTIGALFAGAYLDRTFKKWKDK